MCRALAGRASETLQGYSLYQAIFVFIPMFICIYVPLFLAMGISSTRGLAVLLSINASLSFAIIFFSANERVMEPAPTTLNPQSIKVTGIKAHKIKNTPFLLSICFPPGLKKLLCLLIFL